MTADPRALSSQGDTSRLRRVLRRVGLAPARDLDALRESYNRETKYLLGEIAKQRRVMQENDMWDEFCRLYAERYPV